MDDFDKMFIKEWCDTDLDNLFKLCDNNSCSSSAAVLAVGTFDTFISDIPTLLPCFLRGVLLLSRLLSTSMATILSEAEDDELVPVSYTHLTLPTNSVWCRSRWSPYH